MTAVPRSFDWDAPSRLARAFGALLGLPPVLRGTTFRTFSRGSSFRWTFRPFPPSLGASRHALFEGTVDLHGLVHFLHSSVPVRFLVQAASERVVDDDVFPLHVSQVVARLVVMRASRAALRATSSWLGTSFARAK